MLPGQNMLGVQRSMIWCCSSALNCESTLGAFGALNNACNSTANTRSIRSAGKPVTVHSQYTVRHAQVRHAHTQPVIRTQYAATTQPTILILHSQMLRLYSQYAANAASTQPVLDKLGDNLRVRHNSCHCTRITHLCLSSNLSSLSQLRLVSLFTCTIDERLAQSMSSLFSQ